MGDVLEDRDVVLEQRNVGREVRGLAAIESVLDLQYLEEDSLVRRAVAKSAYEKMRGTRWAPLFNDCASPSPALSAR